MQVELEQTYPRLGTIYSLCSVYYPNIWQRSDVLNRWNFLKAGFYEGIILDYGSWVRHLTTEEIAQTYIDYQVRFPKEDPPQSIDEALKQQFGGVPDFLNSSHRLIIVAGSLDPPTERIVTYLMEVYGVEINAVFFRVFEDDGRRYLTRAWLREPVDIPPEALSRAVTGGEWNGEVYVSFGVGDHRRWSDAKKFGFVSAGGGEWYVNTLRTLQPGNRVWVNVPGTGYVGVGEVVSPAVRFSQFKMSVQGVATSIVNVEVRGGLVCLNSAAQFDKWNRAAVR